MNFSVGCACCSAVKLSVDVLAAAVGRSTPSFTWSLVFTWSGTVNASKRWHFTSIRAGSDKKYYVSLPSNFSLKHPHSLRFRLRILQALSPHLVPPSDKLPSQAIFGAPPLVIASKLAGQSSPTCFKRNCQIMGVSSLFLGSSYNSIGNKILTGECHRSGPNGDSQTMSRPPTYLAFCGAASGSGNGPDLSMPAVLCASASGTSPGDCSEPLELAVTFGTLDFIGSVLTTIPEPTCQITGHCLSLPSRVMWLYQCYRLGKRFRNRPRL